jgi:hypothetical protein
MVASRETLQDIAAERQLQPATLERVIRLIDILDAFGADTLIGPRIVLKGGTALNVFEDGDHLESLLHEDLAERRCVATEPT